MEELKDIRDLDHISIWPLAPGWWIILLSVIVLAIAVIFLIIKKKKFKQSWRFQALQKLQLLRQEKVTHQVVGDMFALLKEVAICKFGRVNCAHLTGDNWLKWLEEHSNTKFKWLENGQALTKLQYGPKAAPLDDDISKKLVTMLSGIEILIK